MCVHSYSLRIESMLLKEEFPAVSEAMKSNISILQTAARGNKTAGFSACVHACVKIHHAASTAGLAPEFSQNVPTKMAFLPVWKKDHGVFSFCVFLQNLRVIQH